MTVKPSTADQICDIIVSHPDFADASLQGQEKFLNCALFTACVHLKTGWSIHASAREGMATHAHILREMR